MTPGAGERRRAFLLACALDVAARKPGNVSHASPGHGMQAAQFLASAQAAAAPLLAEGQPVGARIEGAVAASLAAAGCNTNLGIVLLAAPIAAAAERWPGDGLGGLHEALRAVLRGLGRDDAAGAFRAIAQANPGGLGRVPEHDVAAPPAIGLVEAMALAAPRDRIAAQYAHGGDELFALGVPAFEAGVAAALAAGAPPATALVRGMQGAWLAFVASGPDSHIVRKRGAAEAQCVIAEATPWRERAHHGDAPDDDPAWAAWDDSLKARGLNPGTSADLAVASAWLALLGAPAARTAALGVCPDRIGHGS